MAAPVRWQPSVPTAQGENDKMSTNPIEVFEKRSAEWNMHSRPVLDRATWLLVHAAAARFAGLDPTTSDLAAVGQALGSAPKSSPMRCAYSTKRTCVGPRGADGGQPAAPPP